MHRLVAGGPAGLLLAVAFAGWALLAHPDAPGGTAVAATVLLAALAWVGGVTLTRLHPAAPAVLVGVLAGVAMLAGAPESLTGAPLADPLGYANANAALLVAGVAGLVAAAAGDQGTWRYGLLAGAAGLTVLAMLTESRAGLLSCVLLLGLFLVVDRGDAWGWQALSGLALAGTFGLTALLGATYQPGDSSTLVRETVSTNRAVLWSEALDLAAENPVRGVGPGRFETQSPTARADADLAHAHSAPLQVAAELGWVGLGLLVLLAAWALAALGRWATLLAVIGLQPMIDYTFAFPAVVAASALVLGGACTGAAPLRRADAAYATR